jgi:hypothetical protein
VITEELGGLDEDSVWNVGGLEFPEGLSRHPGRFGTIPGSSGSVKSDSRLKAHPSNRDSGLAIL